MLYYFFSFCLKPHLKYKTKEKNYNCFAVDCKTKSRNGLQFFYNSDIYD